MHALDALALGDGPPASRHHLGASRRAARTVAAPIPLVPPTTTTRSPARLMATSPRRAAPAGRQATPHAFLSCARSLFPVLSFLSLERNWPGERHRRPLTSVA
jgi:hypothetical protein